MTRPADSLSIVLVGASGDLARKKIYPALFALYSQGALPESFNIFGFARSAFSPAEFRSRIMEHLTCRYVPKTRCQDRMDAFLSHCHYVQGNYDSRESFLNLYDSLRAHEPGASANRLFYLAIPPSIFLQVARSIGDAGLVQCGQTTPWSRAVIEKPFGRDRESSDLLTRELARVFTESQTYRIDHYLGKEVIQNLMVLRFANRVFEPVWNSQFIERVHILWKEDVGVADRGGYYDHYGIVRDVMQNHLLQILALVAMEPPVSIRSRDVRDAKVNALRCVSTLGLPDIALGQYGAGMADGKAQSAYTAGPSVPPDSTTSTYAAAILHIRNPRWDGVPFLITAGKATDQRLNEVRIHFRGLQSSIFCGNEAFPCLPANDLIIRIQPDEALRLNIVSKKPGLGLSLVESSLDLRYQAAFQDLIPDAYERLILDVIQGDKSLFIRADELAAAWDIFTPVLQQVEDQHLPPVIYPFGSSGETVCAPLRKRYGFDTTP